MSGQFLSFRDKSTSIFKTLGDGIIKVFKGIGNFITKHWVVAIVAGIAILTTIILLLYYSKHARNS